MTTKSCAFGFALFVALSTMAWAESTEEDLAVAVNLLIAKVEKLESRLAALEGGSIGGDVESGLPEPDSVEGAAVAWDSQSTSESPSSLEDTLPSLANSKGSYLPSRGWREGMHYGGDFQIELHAFLDSEYIDSGSGNSTFDNHHANFFITSQLRKNLRAHTEFEFEHSGDKVETDAAFIEWAPRDWITVTAGRYYTPFGIERFVSYSPTNALISRPEPARQIIASNFYANGVMLSGVVDSGQQSKFTYEVSVSNGLGDSAASDRRGSRQTRDNNSDKALSARLAYVPSPNLEFGTSYHTQGYDDSNRSTLDFFGVDVAARWQGWELRTEYYRASLERPGARDLDQDGYYSQLGYTFSWFRDLLPNMTLVSRFDSVDLDRATVGGDDRDLWSLGINAKVYEHFRIKAEYRFIEEEGLSIDNDTLLGQFVVDF